MSDPTKTKHPERGNEERLPPHSLEAEQGLLACCLIDDTGDCVARLSESLGTRPDFWFDHRHTALWEHLAEMHHHGRPIDLSTVIQRLTVADKTADIGGMSYLVDLPDKTPSALNFDYFWSECVELWKLRRHLRAVKLAEAAIFDPEKKAGEIIEAVEEQILDAADRGEESTILTGKQMMQSALAELDEYKPGIGLKQGIMTGFDYFDRQTTGFYGSEYIVIAGRPGTGKTSWVMDMMDNICITGGLPTLFFSLEMTHAQLAHRWYCQRGRVDFQRLRTGYMQKEDIAKVTKAASEIAKAPLYVDGKSGMNILEIRSKARRYHRRHGIKLICLDYLQLVTPPPGKYYQNREQEVAVISAHILAMAKELDIPVIILAQLNRELDKADRPRPPRLSDLRESGQVEQDAHNVTILYQPKLTDPAEQAMAEDQDWSRNRRRINGIICKQRNGPTGDVKLTYWKHCMHFEEFRPADAEPYKYKGEEGA